MSKRFVALVAVILVLALAGGWYVLQKDAAAVSGLTIFRSAKAATAITAAEFADEYVATRVAAGGDKYIVSLTPVSPDITIVYYYPDRSLTNTLSGTTSLIDEIAVANLGTPRIGVYPNSGLLSRAPLRTYVLDGLTDAPRFDTVEAARASFTR